MTPAKVIIGNRKLTLTNTVGREVVEARRRRNRIADKPVAKDQNLLERLYGVKGGPIRIKRKLSDSERNQAIIHFNAPDSIPDRRDCGIPIIVSMPDMGVEIETRLVPQWRFGAGMRGAIVREAMRRKVAYEMVEKDGKLVLTFK